MALTLWGRSSSTNVQKVLWTLGEVNQPFEHIELGGKFQGLDTPSYRSMNPNGLVPTLRDGDLVIWESHAIVRYLAAQYGAGTLFPADPKDRAAADQWTDWTATMFQPAWMSVFRAVVRTPPQSRKKEVIGGSIIGTERLFRMMDKRLGQVPYLGGEQFTYADIVAGVAMYRWLTMQIGREIYADVLAWHERLKARPAFVAAVELDYSELIGRADA